MLIALGLTPVSPRLGGTRIPDPSAGLADPQTSLKDPPPLPIRGHQSQSQPKLHRWPSQAYHTAHLEAIKGFGMHGYEIDFEVLVQEYQVGQQMNIILMMNGAKILTNAKYVSTTVRLELYVFDDIWCNSHCYMVFDV